MPFAPLFSLLLLLQGQGQAGGEARPPVPAFVRSAEQRFAATNRAERVARDRRLGFSSASGDRAGAALDGASGREREVALMGLACARSPADAARIESAALEGALEEQRAAVLALGEIGPSGLPALHRLATLGEGGLGTYACIALVRTGPDGCELVRELAHDLESAFQEGAYLCLPYAEGGEPPDPAPAFDLLLDLRWEAARRHGFVDGQRWQAVLVEELLEDQEFLDRVVMGASIDGSSDSVRDHFLEIVLAGGSPARLRAPAALAPADLETLIDEDRWSPAGPHEWREILDEVVARRSERAAIDLLKRVKEVPELREPGELAALRGGGKVSPEWLKAALADEAPQRQVVLLEALGENGDAQRAEDILRFLSQSRELAVRSAGLVALLRLGHEASRAEVEALVHGASGAERSACLSALARVGHDPRLQMLLLDALVGAELPADVRLEVELALGEARRLPSRAGLRESLAQGGGSAATRTRVVRVLADGAAADDLVLLREMFPVEDDMDLNVELALAFLRYRDPLAMRLLRTALWSSAFHQAVLAGRLLLEAGGLHALVAELDSIPRHATEVHLRRLGFAIGEWGGFSGVETLARRRGPEDPALQGAYLGALSARTH